MTLSNAQRPLVVAGAILFLLGLLQGAGVHLFANPRMALSAHLTAVQSGLALMVAGAFWSVLTLKPASEGIARLALILGMYGLWIGLTLSAATGASEALPIAGRGYRAGRVTETIVSALVLGASASMTLGWLIFVAGLARLRRE